MGRSGMLGATIGVDAAVFHLGSVSLALHLYNLILYMFLFMVDWVQIQHLTGSERIQAPWGGQGGF